MMQCWICLDCGYIIKWKTIFLNASRMYLFFCVAKTMAWLFGGTLVDSWEVNSKDKIVILLFIRYEFKLLNHS